MSIQKKIILRYRTEGHFRFEFPAGLCSPELADHLIGNLPAFLNKKKHLAIKVLTDILLIYPVKVHRRQITRCPSAS